jgi:hypothetical protein
MSLAGVATALEVSAPGQLRDEQVGVYGELEQKSELLVGWPISSEPDTWKPMTSKEGRWRTRTRQESGRD